MPDVYVAPEPHRCNITSFFWQRDNEMVWYPNGSIWQCDECGRTRRRIRQAVRDA